jgi:dipeptidyl aminopeptidase/acylaminoacyl peptidase
MLWQLAGAWAELPPLIPRDVLFGNPDKVSPRISPDGRRLAYIAPDEGVLNVWIRTVGKNDDRVVTKDRKRGIRYYIWAPDNERLLYIQDKDGDENWHVYCVNLSTNETRDLTPFDGVQARVTAVEHDFPNEILIAINKRSRHVHDVYRANLTTGELTLEAKNDQRFAAWLADHELKIRGGVAVRRDGGHTLKVRDSVESPWRKLATWGPEDALTSGPICFTADGKGFYVLSSTGSNTAQLRELDVAAGTEKTLAYDDQADIAAIFGHAVKHTVQAVAYRKERTEWEVLDESIADDFAAIKRIRRGDFGIINRDYNDETWLVYFETDNGPVYYYAYDRKTRNAGLLFTNRKALENLTLAEMKPVSFKTRDGLTIHGYLTTPVGIPQAGLPTVLLVHGGPWKRDMWGYNGLVQWLANRGYAVLQVNFRGSRGYGKEFLNAGNREWAGKMHDDLVDAVNWATQSGVADPKRVAIFGSSFGGYATLVGLALTPDLFCCGVDICGMCNLVTFLKNAPPYWKPLEPILWDRVGHPERDAEFLKSRSPLFMVDKITKPLLIGQGANDPRVKKSESLQIVEALKKAGRAVKYVEYADEGHGFARPENRLDFYAKAEKFLAKHLGGRYEE